MNLVQRAVKFSLLALTLAGLGACSNEPQPAAAAPENGSPLALVAVQRTNIPDLIEAVGTVQAAQTSDLASQMMGNILEIRVHEGDHVQRGEVLAVIDDAQPRAAVQQASASVAAAGQQLAAASSDLALAETTLHRFQNLYDRKSISPQEFDEVKAREQSALARRDMAHAGQAQARAALAQAQTSLGYTRIRAPFDGVVTAKKADAGMLAAPGMALFTIADVRRYRLEAAVNESDLRFVKIGESVPVAIDALGASSLKGKVTQIVPAADPASRSFLVKIELPANAALRSGLFGHAAFTRGERSALLIPSTAVIERGQLQGVFVLDQKRVASLRYVTVGNAVGPEIEVLSGLQDGEQLVARPGELDLNGKRIEAQ